MIKMFEYACPECGRGTMQTRQILNYKTKIKGYPFVVDEALIGECDQCGARSFAPEETRRWEELFSRSLEARQDIQRGIGLGCPLSPLMGALYLKQLDEQMANTGLFYCRFMDDWVILAPTRWKLRAAIRVVNATLTALKVEQHPDKTFIGRIAESFDFLGYHFSPEGLTVAQQTVERFLDRARRLYKHEPRGPAALERLGAYVRRWWRWVRAGIQPESALGTRHLASAPSAPVTSTGWFTAEPRPGALGVTRWSPPSLPAPRVWVGPAH